MALGSARNDLTNESAGLGQAHTFLTRKLRSFVQKIRNFLEKIFNYLLKAVVGLVYNVGVEIDKSRKKAAEKKVEEDKMYEAAKERKW